MHAYNIQLKYLLTESDAWQKVPVDEIEAAAEAREGSIILVFQK